MNDQSVAAALQSARRLVVVEAPAGCGKTHQGAHYAGKCAASLERGRVLVLTHTHAARAAFLDQTPNLRKRVDVRTIDSLVVSIAAAYHQVLELPPDPGRWAMSEEEGYREIARRVASLLKRAPEIERMLARRFPVVICDEHQDANAYQHEVVMALYRAGSKLRIFGDPMQNIYIKEKGSCAAGLRRWEELASEAGGSKKLDYPHRWRERNALGDWILSARSALESDRQIDLTRDLPDGLSVQRAENTAVSAQGYRLSKSDRGPIDSFVTKAERLLILASHNATVGSLNAVFNRRFPIWEGHVRESLSPLVECIQERAGDPVAISRALTAFLGDVCNGFSASAYGNTLVKEVSTGCQRKRSGKPGKLQLLGRLLLEEPNQRGVARALLALRRWIHDDASFASVKIDFRQEFCDAISLGEFADCAEGLAEVIRRRNASKMMPPRKAISTVNKAKGLECSNVIILPCDKKHFPDTPLGRRRLYVAMSRATSSLMLVVPRNDWSPLLLVRRS